VILPSELESRVSCRYSLERTSHVHRHRHKTQNRKGVSALSRSSSKKKREKETNMKGRMLLKEPLAASVHLASFPSRE
jgi:hypothetical protein